MKKAPSIAEFNAMPAVKLWAQQKVRRVGQEKRKKYKKRVSKKPKAFGWEFSSASDEEYFRRVISKVNFCHKNFRFYTEEIVQNHLFIMLDILISNVSFFNKEID